MKHLLAAARQCALRIPAEAAVCCAAAFLLTAVSTGGQYAPWALAAVAAAGTGWNGAAAGLGALLGALAFLDFQPGLRHGAAALLIFCANTAFCTTRLYRRDWFRPAAAVLASAAVAYGDQLLPALGISLSFSDTAAYFVFLGVYLAVIFVIYYFLRNRVEVTYALAYDSLRPREPENNGAVLGNIFRM